MRLKQIIWFKVIESKFDGTENKKIVTSRNGGCAKKCVNKNVIYSDSTKSFFKLDYFPDSSGWNISCNGPLKMPITVKVLFSIQLLVNCLFIIELQLLVRDATANVHLTYYTPLMRNESELAKYKWTHAPWTPCSATCAGGLLYDITYIHLVI